MHYELKSNIDVTVWEPGYVKSNIHIEGDEAPKAFTLETDKAVADALACLGKDRKTRASLSFIFSPTMPAWVLGPAGAKLERDRYADRSERENKHAAKEKVYEEGI